MSNKSNKMSINTKTTSFKNNIDVGSLIVSVNTDFNIFSEQFDDVNIFECPGIVLSYDIELDDCQVMWFYTYNGIDKHIGNQSYKFVNNYCKILSR